MEDKNKELETQEETTELRKIDPDLVDFMMRNRPKVKPSPHIRNKLLQAALEEKNRAKEDKHRNN